MDQKQDSDSLQVATSLPRPIVEKLKERSRRTGEKVSSQLRRIILEHFAKEEENKE